MDESPRPYDPLPPLQPPDDGLQTVSRGIGKAFVILLAGVVIMFLGAGAFAALVLFLDWAVVPTLSRWF